MSARRDDGDTHWPQVTWTGIDTATLTCTCGAVDAEPVALMHPIAYEAAAARLVFRHGAGVAHDAAEGFDLFGLD